jgi:hypothetical protein
MDRLTELIDALRRNPGLTLSGEDLALLAPAAETEIWAAKALLLDHVKAKRFDQCLPLLEAIVALEPTSENVCNMAVGLRSVGRDQAAIDFLRRREASVDRTAFCELMCSLHARTGDLAKAVLYGDEALALKHEAAPAAASRPSRIAAFDPEAPSRNVIAFSIWGNQRRYLDGAVTNAIVIRYLYPGWTARFYTDGSTPAGFAEALAANGAQVVRVEGQPAATHGPFWRFLVEDDRGVDLYLVRDCDSVVNIKERWAVADWLKRGRAFHLMRDHPAHCELILAGMWGAHRGNIGDMTGRVAAFLDRSLGSLPTADQLFTRRILWPIVQSDVVVHDSWFGFGDPVRYSPDFALPSGMHIGQNDWARRGGLAGQV